jgi:hypothetical protein
MTTCPVRFCNSLCLKVRLAQGPTLLLLLQDLKSRAQPAVNE